MRREMLWAVVGVAVLAACSTTGVPEESGGSTSHIINMDTDAPTIPPLAETSLLALGAYASPIARASGVPALAPGVIVYAPRYALWTDGAAKRRFVQLPAGQKVRVGAGGALTYPTGTKVYKEFYMGGQLHETRVIEKAADGFRIATYVWNEEGTDATRDTDGGTKGAGASRHVIPRQDQCSQCHNDTSNIVLGLGGAQVNPEMSAADASALFDAVPAAFAWNADTSAATQATLGYLHANCGHCHRESGDDAFFALRPADSGQPKANIRSYRAVGVHADTMLERIAALEMPMLGVNVVDPRAKDGDIADGIRAIKAAQAP